MEKAKKSANIPSQLYHVTNDRTYMNKGIQIKKKKISLFSLKALEKNQNNFPLRPWDERQVKFVFWGGC